jgi:hypothetical protein
MYFARQDKLQEGDSPIKFYQGGVGPSREDLRHEPPEIFLF